MLARRFATFLALVVLLLLLAPGAWAEDDSSRQCMSDCLESAIQSEDPDTIQQAIQSCEAQCMSLNMAMGAIGMSGYERGRCIADCASQNRHCLITVRSPIQCHQQYENCKRGCR